MQVLRQTHKIQGTAHQVVAHTGAILTTTATHEHDGVLLDVVALAGDVGGDHAAGGQTHTRRLTLARVGLLGPRDSDL